MPGHRRDSLVSRETGLADLSALKESEFQTQLVQAAQLFKWRVMHTRTVAVTGRNGRRRYMTPIQGDAGFVDLVLAHRLKGVIFAELKSDTAPKKLPEAQQVWRDNLEPHVNYFLWRPADWGGITKILKEGP